MSLAIIFNGQGAHYQGMGQDFVKEFTEAEVIYEKVEKLSGYSIKQMINKDIKKLEQTRYAQIGIVATSLAIYKSIEKELPAPDFMAGLSLGEYSALIASESLSLEAGFEILKKRGQLMADHCKSLRESSNLGMEVVLAMPLEKVKNIITEINKEAEELYVANINSTQQIILAGTKDSLTRFKKLANRKGYRKMMPLKVEGPFHSPYMEAIYQPYEEILEKIIFHEGKTPVISNTVVKEHTVNEIKERLVRHLIEPVRWQETIQYMMDSGVKKIIQIGPGKTLGNLLKREEKAPDYLVIDQVNDLNKMQKFIGG